MDIVATPSELQSPRVRYPWHMKAPNSEEGFCEWAREHAREIRAKVSYLPIFWWNNSYWQTHNGARERDFHAVPAAQEFVDHLDHTKRYFTVSNCDDGVYEDLPWNVLVFNAGGRGDIPIPLLSEPFENQKCDRDLLASFVGRIQCGGPVEAGKPTHSSWDPEGGGVPIRRAMATAFVDEQDCLVEDAVPGTPASLSRFREVLGRSRFALCPRGYGLTSYRLYEAIDAGCVPVYIYDRPWLPYWDKLEWTDFAVLCHVSEVGSLPERLRAIDPGPMAEKLASLREDYFSRQGMYRQIAAYAKAL